jgi:hypothetical protein
MSAPHLQIMTASQHLEDELKKCTAYQVSAEDEALLESLGLEEFIYSKLTSKKFRKWAVDPDSEKQAKGAIHINMSARQPLQFRFPFGGYKLWRLPSAPEVDWAEFFTLSYYSKYLAPIAAVYEPGIEFLFSSDEVIIERMDNVPSADTNAYFKSFKNLLAEFAKYQPDNFKINIVRIGDLYQDKDAMEKELSENIEKFKEEFAKGDAERREKMLETSELNITWKGAKDWTNLSAEDKRKIIEMGPVYHDAYCALSKRREFNRGEDKIVIFPTLIPNAIAIGTTKSSVTKFWTGIGALKPGGEGFKDIVLAPSQLEKAGFDWQDVDLGIPGKNFQKIRILQ